MTAEVPDAVSGPAALVRVPAAVLSHETAARILGLDLVADSLRTWVTVPRSHSHVRLAGCEVRRRDLAPCDVARPRTGVRHTSVLRTVCDLARELPLDEAVAVADSALRLRMVAPDALADTLRSVQGPSSGRVHRVAALLDPRAESVLESLLRVLIADAGLPTPETQRVLGLAGRVDFCWPEQRLVVEADGFAFHSEREAYRRDRERANELVRQGWRLLRFSWEDVRGRRAYVAGLVGACLAASAAA